MQEKHWYLKRCNLLSQLAPEQLARLESRCKIGEFTRNSLIYLPSDASDGCFILAAGRVRIFSVSPDGKQSIVAFIEPGEVFGELAIFEPGRRDDFAEAAEKSTLVLVPGDAIRSLLANSPSLTLGITKLIGLRRRRIERRLRSLLFRSHRQRLIHLLLELAEQFGRKTPSGAQIDIKLSHQELSGVIGSTRESVTLLLGELQREGLITVVRRRIELRAPDRLAAEIDFSPLPSSQQPGSPLKTNSLVSPIPGSIRAPL